ncbi:MULTISPECIES: GntR family transcriptional regulator [Rhodoluna]|uniref:GntR family transcriptional regulator n=1 Tax=Rhodoluna TaxID=529883 RepID=UPI001106C4FF|nr:MULTISPECIES: GntR family transcriptional regulator [Rhodoluna]BDS49322.1 transcriptional regulator [Rhodoluna sp. KAS3]
MNQQENILPLSVFMDLDRSGPIPLYFQVAQKIEDAIMSGQLAAGSRLENEVSLGERLGLSRPTVRRAIQDLVDKGLLVRRRGIGTQVVHGQVTRGVELTSLYEDLSRSGQKPSTKILDYKLTKADAKIAEKLNVAVGSPVLYVKRLRSADKVAVSILENWLPAEFTDITEADLNEHGLYQILRLRGVTIRVAKQRIGARKANQAEATALDIEKNAALLTMDRTAYDNSGHAVEFGHHCYRPDLYSFEVTLVEK